MVDHSISTLAVKAKSNLADCNIRIHLNPSPPLTLLLQAPAKPLAFMLSSRSALTLSAFFTLTRPPPFYPLVPFYFDGGGRYRRELCRLSKTRFVE